MSDKIEIKSDTSPVKIQPVKSNPAGAGQARNRIYVRAVSGLYQKVRQRMGIVSMLSFMILPWLQYNGQQAILFDLAHQQFRIFSVTFWPQDLLLLAFIFIIAAFALVLVTTFIGRVWCGYMCPQTVWTFIFIWFEEKIEGTRHQRMKLDEQPTSKNKVLKKIAKHACWIGFSLFTSLTFIGYFVEIGDLFIDFFTFSAGWLVSFWVLFFTFCTYGNAGWMREIMCTHICPYARLQSAMFDKDTFTVAYDKSRGESRGPRPRKADPKALGLGDCIDCNLCVQVCPTGIDIRNGLQYECINCGACIDACDGVMDKMGYQKGLISYTTERALSGGFTKLFRGKLLVYSVLLVVMIVIFISTLASRTAFDLDIIRDRNQLFRENFNGEIENSYTLKVLNQSQNTVTYRLSLTELAEEYKWMGETQVTVSAGSVETLPVTLAVDPKLLDDTRNDFYFVITTESDNGETETLRQESRFFKGHR
ncbi:cytochrome c oxidase accessory protein CcoG [Catenovulum sp. 2E275]|uniref:cytochrome c oxidase accessory protein CcoG n=1 Tax=Catenovulum sp. 2E275 TaxID=2980497 RepID=UPI0021CF7C81|nr:cytochrome c oxidase accessory protein CcoG [Catenovulum sp. 2E275]MCU4677072.1 cytochrome c oxidase accessory protein CcoG [Catenovulum sp. 2E275]